jgi:NADPH:quinone reductase-like Zn-dependent oxidoreductase
MLFIRVGVGSALQICTPHTEGTMGLGVVQALAKARLPKEGGRVLVLNGSGAVGHLAVQLAKVHYKANVTATTGPGNQELVRNLGAENVLDYTEAGWASKLRESGQQFDAIVDLVGGGRW